MFIERSAVCERCKSATILAKRTVHIPNGSTTTSVGTGNATKSLLLSCTPCTSYHARSRPRPPPPRPRPAPPPRCFLFADPPLLPPSRFLNGGVAAMHCIQDMTCSICSRLMPSPCTAKSCRKSLTHSLLMQGDGVEPSEIQSSLFDKRTIKQHPVSLWSIHNVAVRYGCEWRQRTQCC
jgi:hypothetical protein